MNVTKVFVYGTLKQNEPNHYWILDKSEGFSRFICKAQTVEKYPLIIASRYNIPFLLDVPGQGHHVIGEVYEVDESMLKHLDVLEEHPDFYVREIREVQSENKRIDAWVYFIKKFRPNLLNEPFLEEYSSYGSHGKRYGEGENSHSSYDAQKDIQGIE
ncbi:hypothetical protein R5R35_000416 [Gryllus longicercus]|uniref:Gamma-glutamylcyclotransferase family protein n=1 Tax=Gryllus longicercus TaxID=2509291 RepID=A0AAN9VBV4_9ORTH